MFRFTIRDLLWLMVVMGMGVGWFADHCRSAVFEERFHSIVAELASRNVTVDIDDDGLWISNP